MCRPCFEKYQRVIDLYDILTHGVKEFISNVVPGNEERSSSCNRTAKRSNTSSYPKPSKKRKLLFGKGMDETVSTGVAVSP